MIFRRALGGVHEEKIIRGLVLCKPVWLSYWGDFWVSCENQIQLISCKAAGWAALILQCYLE